MKRSTRVPALVLGLFAACATPSSVKRETFADATLVHNGTIYLGAPSWNAVEALLVREGRVVLAGTEAELASVAPDARRLDLRGGFAVPGLQDAHGHFEGLGAALTNIDLRGTASYAELVERVAQVAATVPEGTWLEGRGWDQNLWTPQEFPTHQRLSAAVPRHPVVLQRVDGHAVLANSAALRAAGLEGERDSERVGDGGRILLDGEGYPTGVFVDDATGLVEKAIPAPSRAQREQRFRLAQEHLLALGLTAVHDMGIDREGLSILRELRSRGELRVRAIEYFSGSPHLSARDLADLPGRADGDDRLALVGVKLYADGALGSRGAALLEPYHDEPTNSGLALLDESELRRAVEVCATHGLQPAVHAIGDRANRLVLDAYAHQLARDPAFRELRPRVEHAQVVSPADWPRFDALGAIASMQPTHATSDMPWAPTRLGPARIAGAYAWRRLVHDPSLLAFGSDFPVESADPRAGLHAAITCERADGTPHGGFLPDQRLSAREAFSAFTFGAARAARQEDRRGRLLPGFAADLTVFDSDPLHIEPRELLEARVMLTLVDGDVVWSAR